MMHTAAPPRAASRPTTRLAPAVGAARFALARGLGSAAAGLSRATGRGSGTTIGGRVALAVDPKALHRAAAGRQVVLVSGTNGKSTTRTLLATALSRAGAVVTNRGGANMPAGLTAALSRNLSAPIAVLEVDEPNVPAVMSATAPLAVVLLNLSRDQLDRYGEVRRLAALWRTALAAAPGTTVVANADDPLVAWAAGTARDVRWISTGLSWRWDASVCPSCGGPVEYDDPDPAGDWRCGCGFRRPRIGWRLESGWLVDPAGMRGPVDLQLPGEVNRGNAAMAAVAATRLGVSLPDALAEMARVSEVDGRYSVHRYAGRQIRLMLAKNPAGWQEALAMVAPPPAGVVIAVNAQGADGRDPAWLWDVPFDRLRGRQVVAAGERCRDVAVRLRYAGVEHVLAYDWRQALGALPATRPIEAIANYTAFQALRKVLAHG